MWSVAHHRTITSHHIIKLGPHNINSSSYRWSVSINRIFNRKNAKEFNTIFDILMQKFLSLPVFKRNASVKFHFRSNIIIMKSMFVRFQWNGNSFAHNDYRCVRNAHGMNAKKTREYKWILRENTSPRKAVMAHILCSVYAMQVGNAEQCLRNTRTSGN